MEHPDEQIAREEITRYYRDRVAEARQALIKAQTDVRRAEAEDTAWGLRGEITPDMVGGKDLAPSMIASAAIDRYQAACQPLLNQMRAVGGGVINTDPNAPSLRAEAERLGAREKALRRWLTAQGYDLGALAEPAPDEAKRRGRRS